MSYTERVIVLVDMDCFFCQVEEKLDKTLEGKPIAVVQYNAWKGGGIIAVNYPARNKGVTRHMRGDEAKQKCPEIILVSVPEVRGKADLTKYREAGKRVANVLQTFTPILERASVDEAYLDITEVVKKKMVTEFDLIAHNNLKNTYVVGYDIQDFLYNIVRNRDYSESNCRLAMGAVIAEDIRAEVYKKTGYKCSAGIAHNKILAKLVCGLHKPNQQTVLPHESVQVLYSDLPLRKVPGLGGKFGNNIADRLEITKTGELINFSEKQLIKQFDEKTAKWIYNIARGIDHEPVTSRLLSKSIGCCKNFPGKSALVAPETVEHWVKELTSELAERLDKDIKENNRKAKQITIHFCHSVNGQEVAKSRTVPLNSYAQLKMAQICLEALKKNCIKSDGTYDIRNLGISAGNFEQIKKIGNISHFFENMRNFNLQKHGYDGDSNLLQQNTKVEKKTSNLTADHYLKEGQPLNEFESAPFVEQSSSEECESDGKICDDNVSIYSAKTDELNEDDPKGLIYYEDIFPESVASEPILIKPLSISDYLKEKSVAELISEGSRQKEESCCGLSSNSFFSKFFENYRNDDNRNSSPIERNFDTSKILMEESECSNEYLMRSELDEGETETKLEKHKGLNSNTCPECKKIVLSSELTSHMDYHYALSIIKEEAHLYKTAPTNSLQKCVKEPLTTNLKNGLKKRIVDMKPIHTYLKADDLNDEDSELCSECNKRIKLDDIINHMDYHAAKKLHLEINAQPQSAPNKNNVINTKVKAKSKRKRNDESRNTIFSFLNHNGV